MIRFSDVSDAPKETIAPEKLNSIETTDQMTDQDVEAFWKAEFENASENIDLDPYERLLSESFNRYVEEIDIDFNVDEELMSTLKDFRTENWAGMDETERMAAIKDIVEKTADMLGLDKVPEIVLYDGAIDDYGAYNPDGNVISLNRNQLFDPVETLNTAMHELRHAFQRYRAEKLETWEDRLFAFNFEYYIVPLPLPHGNYLYFTDYLGQYVEVDARAFANKFTEAMRA